MASHDGRTPHKLAEPPAADGSYEARRAAFTRAEAERAAAAIGAGLPPAAYERMVEQTLLFLTNDPEMSRLLDILVPHPDRSEVVPTATDTESAPSPEHRKRPKP